MYMLSEFIKKVNSLAVKYKKETVLVVIILLISLFSFAIGYIMASYQGMEGIRFIENQ